MTHPSPHTVQPVLTLGAFLKEQAAREQRLPLDQRRAVPTYAHLAGLVGVTPLSVYRLAHQGYLSQLPLALAYRLMRALREEGFQIGVRDIVTWAVPEALAHPADCIWQVQLEVRDPARLGVALGAYLAHLRTLNAQHPTVYPQTVPGWAELSAVAGTSRRHMERFLGDYIERLDLAKLAAILGEIARHGWAAQPEDVLVCPGEVGDA